MMMEVMIVDDDEMVVFLHKVILAECMISFEPVIAHNGSEALDYLLNNGDKGTHYLLFLDINMPVMNAWRFLDELKNNSLNELIYIVIVSSSIDIKDKERAKKYSNVIDYVEKPLPLEYCSVLKEKLKILLNK